VCVREERRETRHGHIIRVKVECGVLIPDVCLGGKLVKCVSLNLFMLDVIDPTMLMMNILGLTGAVEEHSGERSLFVNALRRAWFACTERCVGLKEARAKDEAKASATKRLEMHREINLMLTVF
jgi:hypothetical protein